ncbi:multiple sugar transport system permease protein [Paenibacillus phyllosphaerae]|uniref:Multiple sugar transport system permease protein n=1 Tax=Paenibacillus phyllosphaerae TaxID=274593 RepID=A0A7W5B4Z6_9BACL|nr:sugar ABC transporter permease [Paenibacillus phyllosphaerae]MBB3114502.1 multiple sugar transport system permease protein [Paenibacillus phyllosphaerae]
MLTLREKRARRIAVAFIVPALLFFLLLNAFPLGQVLWDSFQLKNLLNKAENGFAGLANYAEVVKAEYFMTALRNTVIWTVLSVAGEYVLGLVSAIALNQKVIGRTLFRGVIIIPWVVPIVIAGMTWTWMLTPDYGILNIWMVKLGIIDQPYYWLGELNTALLTVVFVNIWRSFPFFTISLLAGLQSVSRDMIEAAAIDGAGVRRRFWHIVLPQLKTVSLTIVFIHIIWTAVNFDFIWVMTEGGPLHSSETLPIMIYRYAMQEYNFGQASALASMMLGFMVAGFVLYYFYATRKNRG